MFPLHSIVALVTLMAYPATDTHSDTGVSPFLGETPCNSCRTGGVPVRKTACSAFVATASQVKPPGKKTDTEGWKNLFDGKSLGGWKRTGFSGGGEVHVEP